MRHRVMRHFLIGELVPPPLAVAGLPSRMKATGSRRELVTGCCTSKGLAPPERAARAAEVLASVAAAAEPKLHAAALAQRKPILGRRHRAPRCRFLDMEPGL